MSERLDRLLEQLQGVKQRGHEYHARCPAHDDHNPSLTVKEDDMGKILICCQKDCQTRDVLAAVGMKMTDLFPESEQKAPTPNRQIVETYDYIDEAGTLLFQAVRYRPKGFAQRRPDGNGGWIWNLNGVKRVLYHLSDVQTAVQAGETVYVVEGEKDVGSLESIGLVATTNAGGAGKWHDSYSRELTGANVVIIPDNDGPGRKHAEEVARSLKGKTQSIKIVELPDLPPKGDITDWLKARHTKEELLALVDSAPEWTPTEATAENGEPREVFTSRLYKLEELLTGEVPPVEWIVENLIPRHGISLVGGDSGVGKSWIAYHLALSLASGAPLFGQFSACASGILICDVESGEALMRRRLHKLRNGMESAGHYVPPELPVLMFAGALRLDQAEDIPKVAAWLGEHNASVVICDPLIHSLSGSENDSRETAQFFERVRRVQAIHPSTFVFTHHSRKRSALAPNDAGQMLRGSSAIRAILDSHIFVRKLKDNRLLVEHDKSRHAEAVPSFVIEIADLDEQSTIVRYVGEAQESGPDQTAVVTAFIERALADEGGALPRKKLVFLAKEEGFKERTVERALQEAVTSSTIDKTREGNSVVYTLRVQEELWTG